MTTALTPEQIKQRLRYQGKQYSAGVFARGGAPERHYLEQAADCIEALEAELAKLRDSECDKIMAMSEEQITALTRMDGSDPNDVAKIGRMACDLALKDVVIQRLEAELAAIWRDADKRGADTIKALADGYAEKVASFARALALKQKDDSMSPLAIEAGDARMELHKAIDAAMAAQEKA